MSTRDDSMAQLAIKRFTRAAMAAVALLFIAATAQGQSASAPAAVRDSSLYRALGEQAGIAALVDDFVNRMYADARLHPFFKDIKQPHLKEELTTQFCQLAGGPCLRDGPSMRDVHDALPIARGDFDRLVEVLQDAMDARKIARTAQGRLLALLAPMHRDIITVH